MSYRYRAHWIHIGNSRRALVVEAADLQRRILIKRSEIIVEAQRLGLTYEELLRLVDAGGTP